MIAGVPGETDLVAVLAVKDPPAQGRSAAMSNGPKSAALRGEKRRSRFQEVRQKLTQRPQHGGSHATIRSIRGGLAGQCTTELVDQTQRVTCRLVRHAQVDHRGGNLFMTEQLLDRVQMGSGFQQVCGEAMAQRMHRRGRKIELFAGEDDEPLQGPARHGGGGLTHALGHGFGIVVASADVGKEKEWMPVKLPVTLEFVPQTGGQRHDAILGPCYCE